MVQRAKGSIGRALQREPDVMRVAPVPLYNRFEDAYRFVEALKAGLL